MTQGRGVGGGGEKALGRNAFGFFSRRGAGQALRAFGEIGNTHEEVVGVTGQDRSENCDQAKLIFSREYNVLATHITCAHP